MTNTKYNVIFSIGIIVWWCSSAFYSSYNRILLKSDLTKKTNICEALKVGFFECLLLALVEYVIEQLTKGNNKKYVFLKPICGIMTFVNTFLMNVLATSKTVHYSQMLKFSEPLLVLLFNVAFFKTKVTNRQWLYSAMIILGAIIYNMPKTKHSNTVIANFTSITPVLLILNSSLRAILMKQRLAHRKESGLSNVLIDIFLTASVCHVIPLVYFKCDFTWSKQYNAVVFLFALYNFVSNRILKNIKVSLHAGGKVGKRVVSVILSIVLVKEYINLQQGIGLTIMIAGLYLFIKTKNKNEILPTNNSKI